LRGQWWLRWWFWWWPNLTASPTVSAISASSKRPPEQRNGRTAHTTSKSTCGHNISRERRNETENVTRTLPPLRLLSGHAIFFSLERRQRRPRRLSWRSPHSAGASHSSGPLLFALGTGYSPRAPPSGILVHSLFRKYNIILLEYTKIGKINQIQLTCVCLVRLLGHKTLKLWFLKSCQKFATFVKPYFLVEKRYLT